MTLQLTVEATAPKGLDAARSAFSWRISSGRGWSAFPFPSGAEAVAPWRGSFAVFLVCWEPWPGFLALVSPLSMLSAAYR